MTARFVRFLSAEPYRGIKSLRAVVRHYGDLGRAESDTRIYTRSSLPRIVPCLNPRCCEGGYDIGELLIGLIDRAAPELSTVLHCGGHDGLPQGRGRGDASCMNSIELDLAIAYRDDDTEHRPTAEASASGRPSDLEA